MVPEPAHEGQEAAVGHDVASPSRPRLLHLHVEPCGGHGGWPPVPILVTPAPAVLPAAGRRGVGRRHSINHGPRNGALTGRPARALVTPHVPAPRDAVRFSAPVSVRRSGSRTGPWRQPVLVPCLPIEWSSASSAAAAQVSKRGLLQSRGLPYLHASRAQQDHFSSTRPEGGSATNQIKGREPRGLGRSTRTSNPHELICIAADCHAKKLPCPMQKTHKAGLRTAYI